MHAALALARPLFCTKSTFLLDRHYAQLCAECPHRYGDAFRLDDDQFALTAAQSWDCCYALAAFSCESLNSGRHRHRQDAISTPLGQVEVIGRRQQLPRQHINSNVGSQPKIWPRKTFPRGAIVLGEEQTHEKNCFDAICDLVGNQPQPR
jgi:hypothetical protein